MSPGRDVCAVYGIGGTGVRTLVRACAEADSGVPVAVGDVSDAGTDVTVALLVVDPTSSVGDEECALLDDLLTRVGTVAVVCTKIDAFWEWPRILRAQRALLDPDRRLPIFAVSSPAALGGAADESGVPALLAWVTEQLDAPSGIGGGTPVRRRVDDAATVQMCDDEVEKLTRRRRMLLTSRDRGRADRLAAARSELGRVRSQSLADVAAGSRALAAAATDRCARISAGGVDDYVSWFTGRTAELSERIDRAVDERIDEVRAVTLAGVDGGPGGSDRTATAEPPPDARPARPVPTGRRGAEDALVVLIGASTGLGIGRLVVAPMASFHTVQWISMPLTLVLGVAIAAWVVRVRRTAALRTEMRGWSTDALAEARARLDHRVTLRVAAAEPQLTGQITRYHERRARDVAAQVARIDVRLRELRSADSSRQSVVAGNR